MQIALLTASNPHDRRAWSGTIYHMAQALQTYCGEVTAIGPLHAPFEMLLGKALHKGSQFFLKQNFLYRHCFPVAKRYAHSATTKLAQRPFDVIIAPNAATEIAFLQTSIPLVLVEDANFALLQEYHQHFSHLLKHSLREAEQLQARAIAQADMLLYPTTWAARSAIDHYHAEQSRVHVVPFGANLETPPPDFALRRHMTRRCQLLFVGVNWYRKGGDIARETLVRLIEMGIPAELTICGCEPPRTAFHKHMHILPFLDKNDEQQRRTLDELYRQADFLLLPTRNECYGIAFCEANAFGLPVITTHTGGVPDVITNGENGYMLPLGADGTQYASLIASLYQDEETYHALVQSSRAAFEQRFNWRSWGMEVGRLLNDLCPPCASP